MAEHRESQFVFWTPGIPAPQGSKRHVGGGRLVESSKKVEPWRRAVAAAARAAQNRGWEPMDGALAVEIEFWLPRPKGHPKTIRTEPIGPPDLDKLCRSTFDALTQSGTIHDDARIVRLTADKQFVPNDVRHALPGDAAEPGALIRVGPRWLRGTIGTNGAETP